jgi:transcriptional regulator with XRE-family HTH domain
VASFGHELRRLADEAGLSLGELARRAHYDKSYVVKVATGAKRPSPQLAEALDAALHAEGGLTALAAASASDEDQRLSRALSTPRRVDHPVLASLAEVLAATRHVEDNSSAATVLPSVREQLAMVRRLTEDARSAIRPAAAGLASEYSQYFAWLLLATGNGKQAAEHLDSAISLGSEADDPNHLNHGLSYKAYAALLADQPGMAASLSAAARRDPRVYPALRAYDAYQEALARATEKDSSVTDRILGEANELAAVATEWKEAAPPGFYWYSPAFMQMQHGLVLLRLGQPARAAAELGRGIGGLPNQYRQAEWTMSYSLPLAIALAQTGDVEQAATAARLATKIAHETGSDLLLHKLRRLHARLPKLPAVSELGDLLHVL